MGQLSMYKGKRILALIAARGGSKGLHRKNLRDLAGKPLIAWSITQAAASERIDRVIVSTEDDEIAETSRQFGADVPLLRPKELATDSSPVSEAILHVMRSLKSMGETYDIVMLLECTSPVRYPDDIDNAIAALTDNPGAQSVVGVVELTHEHPTWTFRLSAGYLSSFISGGHSQENLRRQALEKTYLPFSIYLTWWRSFELYRSFYQPRTLPYLLRREQMADIDDEVDFFITESIMKKYILSSRKESVDKHA